MDIGKSINNIVSQFLNEINVPSDGFSIYPLAGDGSKRSFFRMLVPESGQSFVIMENFPADPMLEKENIAYHMIGKHLFEKGFPLPEIYEYDSRNGIFIMQDMGNKNLQDYAETAANPVAIYQELIDLLLRLQIEGAIGFNTDYCCQTRVYDSSVMREKEAWYFRDSFLVNYLGLKDSVDHLEESFEHLIRSASIAENIFFMHRDFQSRNIMVTLKGFGIIDWQGARLGPLAYDLASLLIDPYVDLTDDIRKELYDYYLRSLRRIDNGLACNFEKTYPYIAILRNLQILGAYSYLTLNQGKDNFEKYIPAAVRSLYRMLDVISDPALSSLCRMVERISRDL